MLKCLYGDMPGWFRAQVLEVIFSSFKKKVSAFSDLLILSEKFRNCLASVLFYNFRTLPIISRLSPACSKHVLEFTLVIFLRTCAWKHLLHGGTQLMNVGHNWMIKLVTNFICATLAETLPLLQKSIYNDAANIFGHLQPKKRNLAGQRWQTKLPIELIQQKTQLLAQINLASLPEQKTALSQQLINIRCKIWSLCKAEKLASVVVH